MVEGTVLVKKEYVEPGLTYAPLNENGVIFFFSNVSEDLGITIEGIQIKFPDISGKGYERDKGRTTRWKGSMVK